MQLRAGNLIVQQTDDDIPGQGLSVVVRRTYNAHHRLADDGLGPGWVLSVADLDAGAEDTSGAVVDVAANRDLRVADLVDVVQGTQQVVGALLELTDGDGTTHRFVRRGGAGLRWDSPFGVSVKVRKVTDGGGLVVAYELVRPERLPLPPWERRPATGSSYCRRAACAATHASSSARCRTTA